MKCKDPSCLPEKLFLHAGLLTRVFAPRVMVAFISLTYSFYIKGNCSMFPSSGLAAETNFTFSCENWIDIDAPLNYEFSYQTNGIKLVLFHRTISSGQAISVTDWLGMGNEKYEYKLNITVQIKDLFGSKSLQVMTAQVSKHFYNVQKLRSFIITSPPHQLILLRNRDTYDVLILSD